MNRWQASIPADKVSIFNLISLTNLSLKLQFCTKKAAMKLSSLPLKMSVSYRNRTYNRVLGGPRYIHLTKETNAVFSGFSALLAPAAISMNSITLVMNFHCILFWHSGQSLLESNSDLSLLNFHKSQPWLNLRSMAYHVIHGSDVTSNIIPYAEWLVVNELYGAKHLFWRSFMCPLGGPISKFLARGHPAKADYYCHSPLP